MDETEYFLTACLENDLPTALDLLTNGRSVNAQNIEGTSGLHIAATNGYTDLAQFLIAQGADVDIPNYCGWTPLMHAAQSGQVSMVSLLVKSKANLNSTSVLGPRALTLAAGGGHHSTVRLLLEAGVSVAEGTHQHPFAIAPLAAAATNGHASIIGLLLQKGFSVNQASPTTGTTSLMLSASGGHLRAVQVLMDNGADPNQKDMCGRTALDMAVICTKMEVAEFLRSRTQVAPSPEQSPTFANIIEAIETSDLRWINSVLREYPSSANWSHPENGTTPLMYAAMLGHLDVAALLVRNNADVERQDYSAGWTALMHAVFHGHTSMVRYLIVVGATIGATAFNGSTALDIACYLDNADTKIRQILIEKQMESHELQQLKGLKGWIGQMTQKFTQLKSKQQGTRTCGLTSPSMSSIALDLQSLDVSSIRTNAAPVLSVSFVIPATSALKMNTPEPAVPLLLPNLAKKIATFSTSLQGKHLATLHSEKRPRKAWEPKCLLRTFTLPDVAEASSTRTSGMHKELTLQSCLQKGVKTFNQHFVDCLGLSEVAYSSINSKTSGGYLSQPTSVSTGLSSCGSIEDLLKELHLEKYIANFKENEVDLEAFVSLNHQDIKAIGVETIPSKELLLQAIHQLQKERKLQ